MIGMSFQLFHLGAKNWTQNFRISLAVSDTVVITGVWCSPEVDWAAYTTTIGFREYDEAGKLVSDKEYQFDAAYFHDMVVTDNWYIVFDCPIKMDYFKTFIGYPFGMNSLGDTIAGAAPAPACACASNSLLSVYSCSSSLSDWYCVLPRRVGAGCL